MKNSVRSTFGVGPTRELNLRVSVASLARVLFRQLGRNDWMLALERKATLVEQENSGFVEVIAQPFGGAVRILDCQALNDIIGNFHFDSERSRIEGDFRLFIRPGVLSALRAFIIEQFSSVEDEVLEIDPDRELVEEFEDALSIKLKSSQYVSKPVGTIIEENPTPTANTRARGFPTVRVYRLFETRFIDQDVARRIITESHRYTDNDLADFARLDKQKGGKGRANGILALSLKEIMGIYEQMPIQDRNTSIDFQGHQLAETVPAVLEKIEVPKYQRL